MANASKTTREQAERIRAQRAARAQDEVKPTVSEQAPRTKTVRKSIDLPPKDAANLAAWESETAQMLGASRVTSADVCRALVHRLLTDETLARTIRGDLRTMINNK